ncbi:ATP-binding cassette domain-containing protein [Streptomyces fructofermentans]|uniref:ATP-binding cassette domain-containing protein n=1 Tax=Streptomyces fructofermentans TaxID=152141 RepID=UPI0033C87C34
MAIHVHRPENTPQAPAHDTRAPRRKAPASPSPAVRVAGLTRVFDGRPVLDNLGLDVGTGEFVALLGHGGRGESTLLRVLAGLDREVTGTVLVARRRALALPAPRPGQPWRKVWRSVLPGPPGRTERAASERLLAEVGLAHRAAARLRALTDLEARRLALAQALAYDPGLLLLDDPFATLDPGARTAAQHLVGDVWRRRGCAVLLATRDVEEALLLADRVLVLDEGAIAYEAAVPMGRPRDVTDRRFAELRGRLLARLGAPTSPGRHGNDSGPGVGPGGGPGGRPADDTDDGPADGTGRSAPLP